MLDLLHGCSRYIHIVVGFIGLVVFWFPVLSKKGGRLHRFSGKVFAACAIIVGITGLLGGTWGTIAPLNYLATTGRPATSEQSQQLAEFIRFFMAILVVLSSATLNGACLGLATVWAKTDHQKLKAAWVLIPLLLNFLTAALLTLSGVIHLSSPSMGLNLVSASEAGKYWLHVILGAVVFITTLPDWHFIMQPPASKFSWYYKHVETMLGVGIAFYTAFLVFGASRFYGPLGIKLSGGLRFIPWVLPSVIGIPIIQYWVRSLKAKLEKKVET